MIKRLLLGLALLALGTAPLQAQSQRQPLATAHTRTAVTSGQAPLLGRLPAGQSLHLSIALPLRDQAGLDAFVHEVADPASPNYRHYLSVEDFTRRFGPSAADYQALIDFAASHHLQLSATAPNRLLIEVDGAVADIESAFHVTLGLYRHPTEPRSFYAPDREPSADLAVPLWHIGGLDSYSIPRPNLVRQPAASVGPADGSGPDGVYLAKDMRVAYYGGTALTGAGQSIGLLQFGGYWSGDVDNYYSTTGQTNTVPITNVLVGGVANCPSACDDDEEVTDIVQSIGMAPGLDRVLVYSGENDATILNRMASDNIAKQLSVSWTWDPADPSTDDPYFEEMASQGQSIFVASGDCGSYVSGADPGGCKGGVGSYGPQFPPEDLHVTAVGGTALSMTGSGKAYQGETGWSSSGGGYGDSGFALPSWQSGLATAANGASTSRRNVPDVAADANGDSYYCSNGVCDPNNFVLGGTSLAAPRWAGFMALVNQQAVANGKPTVGFLNPTLYALLKGGSASGLLHDTSAGNNGGFSAVAGYDLVTGLGSPNGQTLINALSGAATLQAPVVTALSPASGPTAGGTAVTLTGTGFTGATKVAFGAVAATKFTVESSTEIVATAPAEAAGAVFVTVATPSGTSGTVSAARYTYLSGGQSVVPAVTAISPASGPAAGGTSVGIAGSNFTGATAVAFGSTSADFTVVSDTQIIATAPAESAGTVDVTVTGPGGTSATGAADRYSYAAATPAGPSSPVIAFGSGSFTKPVDVARDAAGNLFVADAGANAIKEILAANPGGPIAVAAAAGFNQPFGVALDGSGNLFVADTYNNRVVEIAKSGGYANVTTIGAAQGNFAYPTGLALDAAGDVFVLDWGNNALKEIVTAGGYRTVLTLAPNASLKGPYGIALDGNGNVFIADSGNNQIKEVTAAGGYSSAAVLGGAASFDNPRGVAVDAGGNLFIGDRDNGAVREIAAAGGYASVTTLTAPGISGPAGLALDAGGDIFVADEGKVDVAEILRAAPSAASPLGAAILPGSRAVQTGAPATVFATLLNSGGTSLSGCAPALLATAPSGMALDYRPTNSATNQPTGTQDEPVSIAAQGAQSFVLAFSDATAASVRALPVVFSCTDALPAPSVTGLDTVDLLFSTTPVADIIALAATASNDGTVHVANGAGAFAVATIDAGAAGTLTATLDTGAAILPLGATLCQTDASGQCQAPPSASLAVSFVANATPTFSVFVTASAPIAFAPGTSRIFLRFVDASGVSHGSTSVAVTTG